MDTICPIFMAAPRVRRRVDAIRVALADVVSNDEFLLLLLLLLVVLLLLLVVPPMRRDATSPTAP